MSTKYYDIYIPLTYEGSIRLGKGTQWCTATEETDEHYKIYTKDGTLYVLINKKNPKIKYQFHNEAKELANNNDYSLSPFTFAKLDKGLIDFFQTFYDDLDFKKTVDFIKEFKSGVIYDGNKITCNGQLVPPILYEHITKLIIKEGVKKIKNGGFSDKHLYDDYPFGNLKEVIFPDSLVEIGSNCFSGAPYYKSNLSTIYISKNISKIGKSCFSYHPLKRIIVDKDNETFDSRDDCNAIIETNTNTLIKGSSNTIIPKSIKSIGDDAFLGNNAIKRISIPSNIEEIGDCCFAYCWKLNKIHLSNGLKIIGTDAFYSCSYIERIKLPDTVEVIGSFAFRDTNISTFQLPKNLKRLGEYIYSFTDINNIEKLHVSKHIEYLTPISFGNIGINNISVDPDNKKYDSRKNCNAIIETKTNKLVLGCNNTVIPKGVIKIGKFAFINCKMKQLIIPKNIKTIEKEAFDTSSIKKIIIEGDVRIINSRLFCNSKIKEVNIKGKTEIISDYAFIGCKKLEKLILPSSIKIIGAEAFYECKKLKTITFLGTKNQWKKINKHTEFYVKDSSEDIIVSCINGEIIEKSFLIKDSIGYL